MFNDGCLVVGLSAGLLALSVAWVYRSRRVGEPPDPQICGNALSCDNSEVGNVFER